MQKTLANINDYVCGPLRTLSHPHQPCHPAIGATLTDQQTHQHDIIWYQYLIQSDTNMQNDSIHSWGLGVERTPSWIRFASIKHHLCDSRMKLNIKNQEPKGTGPQSEIKHNQTYFRKGNVVSTTTTTIINNHDHFMKHRWPSIDRPSSIHQIQTDIDFKTLAIPPPARQLRQCASAWTEPRIFALTTWQPFALHEWTCYDVPLVLAKTCPQQLWQTAKFLLWTWAKPSKA